MSGQTLFDKIWSSHVVAELEGNRAVLLIDRIMLHEITGGYALRDMRARGERPAMPADQIFAVADHAISTEPGRARHDSPSPNGGDLIASLEEACGVFGIPYAQPDGPQHGIVHVIAPELGFIAPGVTLVCGDSHTCTLGAFGALAFAVGATEIGMVLRHRALVVQRPRNLRVMFMGALPKRVYSKDAMLSLLARHGSDVAIGYVVEFAGSLIPHLPVEARLTLCNMGAEMGTRYAVIAPDQVLFDYIGRQSGNGRLAGQENLCSDADAVFDKELRHSVDDLAPQVTWGTVPMHAVPVDGVVPAPYAGAAKTDARALEYMQLKPGTPLQTVPIDAAFIGSCTNARLSDLREAAEILRGRRVASGVRAMCTPGSMAVRLAAEAEGLHEVFLGAGFQWRMPGCSNCAGREGPIWSGLRVISSTNRNFEHRQGPNVKTHIASPATVAASAINGRISDPRDL
jgi:3-isopropylmalate/(R)-2-methylmalate dehydratase large subunit